MEDLGNFARVPVDIEAVLEAPKMTVFQILQLEPGSLIRLNRTAGENVDVRVAGVCTVHGDIVAVQDKLCIRVTGVRERP
jgi:flagellar motor switch protein FliN/FliY